jgi:hypothetical protein
MAVKVTIKAKLEGGQWDSLHDLVGRRIGTLQITEINSNGWVYLEGEVEELNIVEKRY